MKLEAPFKINSSSKTDKFWEKIKILINSIKNHISNSIQWNFSVPKLKWPTWTICKVIHSWYKLRLAIYLATYTEIIHQTISSFQLIKFGNSMPINSNTLSYFAVSYYLNPQVIKDEIETYKNLISFIKLHVGSARQWSNRIIIRIQPRSTTT